MSAAYIPAVQTDCCVDLSHSNAIADPVSAFRDAQSSGVALIIQKASQGLTFVDPTFGPRRIAAAQVGLLFGAYHFCDGSSPISQMSHFLATVGNPSGVLLALDAERNAASQVTVEQLEAMVTYLHTATSRFPLLYMGASGPAGDGYTASATLSKCDLWLPEYGSRPVCPAGFDRWVLHQYTGDGINGSGEVAGIGRGLDRSYFAGTVADLQAWFAKATGAGTVPPLTPQLRQTLPPLPTAPSLLPDLKTAQAALGVTADGIWGPNTAAAFERYYS